MVYTSRVPGTRLSSVSRLCATFASACPSMAGSSLHRVSAITGTSSMPFGLTNGWPTPTPGGIQSWLEYTWLYRRTMAGWRSTPTVYSTVSTAMPGREIEYTCLTPSISDNFFSSGKLTSCSTWRASAPGNGTNTLAMVTSICGSSSCGVTSTATRPSNRPRMARIGVSGLSWKRAAKRPEMPSLPVSAISALLCGVEFGQRLRGAHRIGGHAFALRQAGQHFDPVAAAFADAHLTQQQAVFAQHIHAGQFTALPERALRQPKRAGAAGTGRETHRGDLAGHQRAGIGRQLDAHGHAVRVGMGTGIHEHLRGGQHATVGQGDVGLRRGAQRRRHALRHLHLDAEAARIEHAQQRLAGRHAFARLHQALRHHAGERRAHLGVIGLLRRLRHLR